MAKPTHGSLFTGIGGFDLGFEQAAIQTTWQVEIDTECNDVLAHHWPDVRRYGDVRTVGKHNLEPVDVISGGFPCQDVSVAGKRKGLAGERSGLWFEFHRVLAELRPRWVVVENVPGLLSSNGGGDFASVLQGLVEIGYGVCWRILDAQYFGVAQRRRRVFVIGSLGDGCAAEVLFESKSLSRDSPPSREAGEGITAPVKASSPSRRGGGSWPIAEEFVVAINNDSRAAVDTIAHPLRGGDGRMQQMVAGTLTGQMQGQSNQWPPVNEADNLIPVPDLAYTLPASVRATGDGHGQGWNSNYIIAKSLNAHAGRFQEDSETLLPVAYNWQSGGDVRLSFGKPNLQAHQVPAVGVRRLTPTECERLQGFPDGWTAVNGQSDSARYRQLGNAVCVPVARWIGGRIKEQGAWAIIAQAFA